MSDKFTELFTEAKAAGIDPEWLTRLEKSFEASGLRQDLKDTRDKYAAAMADNRTLRTGLLNGEFTKLGISIKPAALNIPDDLDASDPDKVSTWATEMGLYSPPPTTDPALRAAHDRISAASTDGNSNVIPTVADLDPSKLTEDEFYAQAALISANRK